MSGNARAALASADDVLARIRSRVDASEPTAADGDTADAQRIAEEWARYVADLYDATKRAEAATNFRQRWPAIVRWRDGVLANQRRARPSLVAAAYESLALECTLAGEYHLAAKAQQAALDVVRRVARDHPPATEAASA